jgi:hypothetical protein
MFLAAARVLVELADVITEVTGSLDYARNVCAPLAANYDDHDLPSNLRAAMAFVQRETAGPQSADRLRTALAHARTFFEEMSANPTTVFVTP